MASETHEAAIATRDHDGRNIDERLGALAGEAGGIEVKRPEDAFPTRGIADRGIAVTLSPEPDATYYDQPMLAEPVWKWAIPTYFFVGGLAGAASALGAAAEVLDERRLRGLVRASRWIGATGDTLSAGLLVYDLGRPARFLNMLRVFRLTSPMSVGTYVLSISGAANTASLLLGTRGGWLRRTGKAASVVGGVMGLPLSGYTAVLLTNTAVPPWQGASRSLPYLFVASSMASAGSLLSILPLGPRERSIARRFAIAGQIAEVAASLAVSHELNRVPTVGRALHEGVAGALWVGAKAMAVSSLALSLLPRRSRWARTTAGVLGLASSLAMRFAVFQAGKASVRDPRAAFHSQRAAR